MGSLLRQVERSKNWLARFRGPDGKWLQRSTGTPDKRLAEQILQQFMRDARTAQVDGGFIPSVLIKNASDFHRVATGKDLNLPSLRKFLEQFLHAKTIGIVPLFWSS